MAYEKNRRRPPREDDGTLIEGRNAVLETLRAGRTVDKVFVAEGARIGDVAAEARRHGSTASRSSPATGASSTI